LTDAYSKLKKFLRLAIGSRETQLARHHHPSWNP